MRPYVMRNTDALQNLTEFERVLSHEFTHALVRSVAPRGVPFWFNEGLAVNYEGSDLAKQTEQVRKAASLLPLSRLEPDEFREKLGWALGRIRATDAGMRAGRLCPAPERCDWQGGCKYPSICRSEG